MVLPQALAANQERGLTVEREQSALIVFAREPRPGKVKTRLEQSYPAQTVYELYQIFLTAVLASSRAVRCSKKFIFYTGARTTPFLDRYRKDFTLRRQSGSDLGMRMHNAFRQAERGGIGKTIIVGTDCLTLDRADLQRALTRLNEADVVLGPSLDGGYYLIGLRRPAKALFENIAWSTPKVLKTTLNKARQLNLRVDLLEEKRDIDTAADLEKFLKISNGSPSAAVVRRCLARAGKIE